MKTRAFFAILLTLLFAFSVASAAFASHGAAPVGSCPPPFEMHHVGMHDHEGHDENMPHKHVGLDHDLNGDGYWCVKHVGPGGNIHVHIDNRLPLS